MSVQEIVSFISALGLLEDTNLWKGILILIGMLTASWIFLLTLYKLVKKALVIVNAQRFKTVLSKCESKGLIKSFQIQDFKEAKKNYIVPNCSNIDPTNSDQFHSNVGVKQNIYDALDNELIGVNKRHILILADSGMGKTTFLINYFRKLNANNRVALLSLSRGDAEAFIKNIPQQNETILLLDAFDEDANAIRDFNKRMTEIMNAAQDFKAILITCRTQFFLNDGSIPTQTGIARVGSRKTSVPSYYEWKTVYILPFDNHQVDQYIKSTIPFWDFADRKKAKSVVSKIPELALRPMLLNLVPDLTKSSAEISEVWQLYEFMVTQWAKRESHWIAEDELIGFSKKLAVDLVFNRDIRQSERISLKELEMLINVTNVDQWKLTGRSLLNRDSFGNFKFAHRSIMEYMFIKAFIEGARECSSVKWTDLMCELFISWGNCNNLPRDKLDHIFELDFRKTGLFPITNIRQADFTPNKSWISNVVTNSTSIKLPKNSVPTLWRRYTSKIIEADNLIRVYDFATGLTFQLIKTFDKSNDEMCIYRVNRYVSKWKDDSTSSEWYLPKYSEFKNLCEILALEGKLDVLDYRSLYWLAERPSFNEYYLASIRDESTKEPLEISGLVLETTDYERIGKVFFYIDIYIARVKYAPVDSILALPISVCEKEASELWYRDNHNKDDGLWFLTPATSPNLLPSDVNLI